MILIAIYIFFTFFPAIYTYLPVFGQLKIVFIIGVLIVLKIVFGSKELKYNIFCNNIFIIMVLFAFLMFVSVIFSLDRGMSYSISIVFLKYIFINIAMLYFIKNNKEIDFLLITWVLCSFLMSISTIVNYFLFEFTFEGSIRGTAVASGILADPNDLSLFLNASLPVIFYFYYKYNKSKLLIIPIVCVVVAVVLTYSRGGFVGLLFVIIGLFVLLEKERMKIFLFMMTLMVLFVFFAPETYKARLATIVTESQIDEQTGQYPGRLQAWVDLLPVGFESPFFGHGARASVYLAGRHINDWHVIHNTFLQVFLELGLFGLIAYLLFYVLPYKQYKKMKLNKIFTNSDLIIRQKFLLLSLFGFGITSIFLPQAYSQIFFFIVGVLAVQQKLVDQMMPSAKKGPVK